MKNLLIISFLLAFHITKAQYYYKDVIGTRETADQMKKLVAAKIQSVILTSYDGRFFRATNGFPKTLHS